MRFTIVTSPLADHQLATIWLSASKRQEVADAFDQIERELKENAHIQGREHPSGWRVITRNPLTATFKVSEDDRLVTIISVFCLP